MTSGSSVWYESKQFPPFYNWSTLHHLEFLISITVSSSAAERELFLMAFVPLASHHHGVQVLYLGDLYHLKVWLLVFVTILSRTRAKTIRVVCKISSTWTYKAPTCPCFPRSCNVWEVWNCSLYLCLGLWHGKPRRYLPFWSLRAFH